MFLLITQKFGLGQTNKIFFTKSSMDFFLTSLP